MRVAKMFHHYTLLHAPACLQPFFLHDEEDEEEDEDDEVGMDI